MEESNKKKLNSAYYEITLRELFYVLFNEKKIIVSITAFASIFVVIYSLLLPNVYESKAILVPVDLPSSISSSLNGYSNLAGLAGINLPSSNDGANSQKAIKKISTLSFFENNIYTKIYLPDLMAIKSWSPKTNKISYDQKIYDIDTNAWVRDYDYPRKQIPTAQESFRLFQEEHLNVSEDQLTGFVTISIKHQSPFIAKTWLELIINEVNSFYRQRDKIESETASKYLNQQISMTGFSEIKQVLAQLLQEETKKLALIEAREFYVFEYIDPPAEMELKSYPARALICILGALLGGILSVIYVLIRHYFFIDKASKST